MNYDILLNLDILYWIQAVIALFLGALMINDHRKYKDPLFLLMGFVFIAIFAKAVIFLGMNFTHLYYAKDISKSTGVEFRAPDKLAQGLYDLRYLVWQYLELIFVIVLTYTFILSRRKADSSDKKHGSGTKIGLWIQVIVATAVVGVLVVLSLKTSTSIETTVKKGVNAFETIQNVPIPKSSIDAVNLLTSGLIKWILVLWKLALLIIAWVTVSSIYGYTANVLKSISKYKRLIYFIFALEIVYNVFSAVVNFYAVPGWIFVQIFSVFLLAIFGFNIHTEYITSVQQQVENLEKQLDITIALMRDISAIVGSGDFDLDVVVKQIVDASMRGTSARGGAVLLKDQVTNRLIVKYVNGLYPPAKPFKSTSGMALTENTIIEKFKSEKIAIGEGLIGQVAESGETIYIPDAVKSKRFSQTVPEHMLVTSFIAVPLKSKDDVFGVLTLVDDSRLFLGSDVNLLETLGEQAAITIKQIQMYQQILEKKQAEKEVGVAAEIQTSLVPHIFPETDKYDLYAFSIAAKGVGGDYYDYIDFGNNKIALAMFDVSGKGVPAALIMVMIRSILRTIASLEEDTKDVVTRLNDTASQDIVEDRYATGFYLLFDAEKGIMSYTNAGHGPLVLYRASQDQFEFLDTEGMPVGIMAGVEYGQNYTTLEKGDLAILYTDGITEAMNNSHEEFGMDRFKDIIRKNRRETARGVSDKILEEVNRFVAGAPQHDDETLLVLKMK
jgi:sigma-B regulation protein RsbU (phosphoserine phosphatase)